MKKSPTLDATQSFKCRGKSVWTNLHEDVVCVSSCHLRHGGPVLLQQDLLVIRGLGLGGEDHLLTIGVLREGEIDVFRDSLNKMSEPMDNSVKNITIACSIKDHRFA